MGAARRRAAVAAAATAWLLLTGLPARAATPFVDAPLDPYPVAAPSPLGTSHPPDFLDEDETVRAQLAPDGSVKKVVDDAILRIRGSGDYTIFLPARVTEIANLGGDSPPGLQDGHVSFLGNVIGQSQLGVEATLDRAALKSMPITLVVTYSAGGHGVSAGGLATARGPITVNLAMANITAAPHQFISGDSGAANLAPTLENLRQASLLYTPETDLQALLPLPPSIPVAQPAGFVTRDNYVPLAITATVRLPVNATLVDAGGADVVADSRGSRLTWLARLPSALSSGDRRTLSFSFSSAHPTVPAIEVKADPIPFPAATFTPPGGGAWAPYLAGLKDHSAPAMLAQEGAASIHRIGELTQPLGRPGPGPVKVKYDFVLDSGPATAPPGRAPAPVHAQPWAVVAALVLAGLLAVSGAATWARH